MNELALFAGALGGVLGGHLIGWRCVGAVECEGYPRGIAAARQNDGCLPPFPVWTDVRSFTKRNNACRRYIRWLRSIRRTLVISGGFPCQDISAAGKGAGIEGERSGLWKEFARVIGEIRPRFVLVENSPVLTSRGLGVVLGDLAALGYDARWGVLGAHHAGAPHKRDRIWIRAWAAVLFPTPDTGRTPNGHGARGGKPGNGKQSGASLTAMAKHAMWPTPTKQDANGRTHHNQRHGSVTPSLLGVVTQRYPTPTKQDASNNGGPSQMERNSLPLNAVAGGSLNPMWVEWLMGWPLGWTDLRPLGMDRFRRWCASHGRSWPDIKTLRQGAPETGRHAEA